MYNTVDNCHVCICRLKIEILCLQPAHCLSVRFERVLYTVHECGLEKRIGVSVWGVHSGGGEPYIGWGLMFPGVRDSFGGHLLARCEVHGISGTWLIFSALFARWQQ